MNTNRIAASKAGWFGLIAQSTSGRTVLPLKGVECEFTVRAGIVSVTITQVFRQDNPKPLDCDYLFPLPADASVYRCEADINGRIITALVRERQEAVRLAAEKKAEGRRVVLVESERENLFTLSLSNLQPEDLIIVTLKYIQPLRLLGDFLSVEIPFCPGVRYIPGKPLIRSNRGRGIQDDTDQVPDASRLSPVRIDKEHPDAAYIEVRGVVDAGFADANSLESPSHNIISRKQDHDLTIRLSDKDEVPDRDFVLRWKEHDAEQVASRAWTYQQGDHEYALMEIRPPKADVGTAKPMDFYFLVDRSGSMEGQKWEKAAEAVLSSVRLLGSADRVMVTLFGNDWNDFAEKPLAPSALLMDRNLQKLNNYPVGGGTEMLPAMQHVLAIANVHSKDRDKSLILITDAQVGNEEPILKLMGSSPDFTIHCFGIDNALNDALLVDLARQQKGTFHSMNPQDDVVKAVTALAQTIRHPVLVDLQLSDGWEVSDDFLPPLFSGKTTYLSARKMGEGKLTLTAKNGTGTRAQLPLQTTPTPEAMPYLHWCKNRIRHSMSKRDEAGAVKLSVASNLICPLTAFIAWDEQEKVAVASHQLGQPSTVLKEAPRFSLCAPVYGSAPSFSGLSAGAGISEGFVSKKMFSGLARTGTIAEQLASFRKLFAQICQLAKHPEWMADCERVLDWISAGKDESEFRCRRAGVMISGLMVSAKQLQDQYASTMELLGQLKQAHEQAGLRVEELLGKLDAGQLGMPELTDHVDMFTGNKHIDELNHRVASSLKHLESALHETHQWLHDIVP